MFFLANLSIIACNQAFTFFQSFFSFTQTALAAFKSFSLIAFSKAFLLSVNIFLKAEFLEAFLILCFKAFFAHLIIGILYCLFIIY